MKSIKIVGMCFAAMFLVSAAITTAAAAAEELPEFKVEESEKENPRAFTSRGGTFTLETSKGERVICEKEFNAGELEANPSSKYRDILIFLEGCTTIIAGNTYTCKSPGANAGEIETFDLLGRFGYISKAAPRKVGLLINPEERTGNPNNLIAEFTCTFNNMNVPVRVKGSLIALVTPINKLVDVGETFILTFSKENPGKQVDKKFEGEPENHLVTETPTSGGGFIESGVAGDIELFFIVSSEISA